MKVYTYAKCSTCRKATAWLRTHGIAFEEIPIREIPPSQVELKRMVAACDGDLRRLFNTSGQDYRAMGLKDKLSELSATEAIELLSANGNLVKRPFLIEGSTGLVGFREEEWKSKLV